MLKFRGPSENRRFKVENISSLSKKTKSVASVSARYDAVYSDDVWSDEHENNAVFDKKSLEFQSAPVFSPSDRSR